MPANRGQLIADATCAPADIRFPTDVSLLNEARNKTDEVIDELHTPLVGKVSRPRTYRIKARRKFLALSKPYFVGDELPRMEPRPTAVQHSSAPVRRRVYRSKRLCFRH